MLSKTLQVPPYGLSFRNVLTSLHFQFASLPSTTWQLPSHCILGPPIGNQLITLVQEDLLSQQKCVQSCYFFVSRGSHNISWVDKNSWKKMSSPDSLGQLVKHGTMTASSSSNGGAFQMKHQWLEFLSAFLGEFLVENLGSWDILRKKMHLNINSKLKCLKLIAMSTPFNTLLKPSNHSMHPKTHIGPRHQSANGSWNHRNWA